MECSAAKLSSEEVNLSGHSKMNFPSPLSGTFDSTSFSRARSPSKSEFFVQIDVFGGSQERTPLIEIIVESSMLILSEEIFGPILPILTIKSLDEGISLIQEQPKPLAKYNNRWINIILASSMQVKLLKKMIIIPFKFNTIFFT